MNKHSEGFTIIELLVVIVVIGILAAITIVSYAGISNRAVVVSMKSDLANASTKLKMFLGENDSYPDSITDCPVPSSNNICLKLSNGSTLLNYSANNSTNPPTYQLSISNGSNIYQISSISQTPATLASAPLSPAADWLATTKSGHYGNFYDLASKSYATVTRSTPKTIYDPSSQKIYDVPANNLGIRPRSDGKSGMEAEIEEGRTNYLPHSYFDIDSDSNGLSDGWTIVPYNSTQTYSRSAAGSVYGNTQKIQQAHIDGTAAGQPHIYNSSTDATFSAGDNASATIYYRNLAYRGNDAVQLVLAAYSSGLSSQLGSVYIALTPSSNWQRASLSYANLPTGTSRVLLKIQQTQSANGDYFEVELAAAQLEKGAFATSYIPTTTSSSSRNADTVSVPTVNWNANGGSWFAVAGDPLAQWSKMLMGWGSGSANVYSFFTHGANSPYAQFVSGGTTAERSMSRSAGYFSSAVTWSVGSPLTIYANGASGGSSGVSMASGLNPSPSSAYIGKSGYSASGYYNGPIQRVTIYKTALSASDVSTVTNKIKDGP